MSPNSSNPRPPKPPVLPAPLRRGILSTETNLNTSQASSPRSFEDLYFRKLKPALDRLEEQRKSVLSRGLTTFFLALATLGALFASGYPVNEFTIIIALAIPALIGFVWVYPKFSNFKNEFKADVVKVLVENLFSGFKFDHALGIPRGQYMASRLFQRHPDRYKSEDYISGKIGVTPFHFSEVHSEYKQTVQTKNGRRTTWHTIFKGIFFVADFNKNIKGSTFVLPDIAEKAMGSFLGGLLQGVASNFESRGELVKLENVEFEKNFVVYSNDQVEARYILTPSLMEKILSIRSRFNQTPHLAFSGNHVYVAISMKDLFEPRIFRSLNNKEDPELFVEIVKAVSGIIEDLDLNTRIWTK